MDFRIMEHALETYSNGKLIFYDDGNWLYPLFRLEQFLSTSEYHAPNLLVKDKIIGKAAALLLINLKIGYVSGEIMSQLGKDALDKYGVQNDYDNLVDRINCQTEQLLENEFNPQIAYQLLKQRADL